MGFFDKVRSVGRKIGQVGRTAARVVGQVAGAIDSPIGRMVTSVGSKLPVVGSAFSWARDLAPKVKQGADLVEEGFKLGDDVASAVKNRDVSQVGDLLSRGASLVSSGKSMIPSRKISPSVPSVPSRGAAGVPIMSMDNL